MPLLSLSGQRPTSLGLKKNQLTPCPNTPNCVCSQDPDPGHQIDPLTFEGAPKDAFAKLKTILADTGNAEIIQETRNYIYAEFTSGLMGFVDDVEFYLDNRAKVIQVRSASRLGKSDLGANKSRVKSIQKKLKKA
ncbi:DUF1499 domain-containing protein [Acaryochloris sp. CCMEE 5410]|uniref:DUF1499 domain-containing protein n=1 Tax=Acaryochloris sp. CCMEE 5410 TaxID=310037 RepID=UPI0002484149|nr:DUF1499 domain-containing protein [Acaryochloris sp. CCMEE 5410]KAI9133896.1 DUF1499 domain-containing protein [Acaryochloris sp. CCMEE 5410]